MQQAYMYLYFNQDSLFKPYITVPKQDKKNLQQWGFIEIWQLKHTTKFTRIFSTLCQKLNQKNNEEISHLLVQLKHMSKQQCML